MASALSARLAAACSSLGYYDGENNSYHADSNVLEPLKDIIRFLRRDDNNFDIRIQLGDTKVVQTDLMPMLKDYWEEVGLFDVVLRLTVNLTTPTLILWKDEIPTEKVPRKRYLQIQDHLQSYKQAFVDEQVWAALTTKISRILEIDYYERGDENSLIMERILILVRNILCIPSNPMEMRPDNDASIHDQVLWALQQSGMLDVILYIASSPREQVYYMHVLEIMFHMFREQTPKGLMNADMQRSSLEKKRDEDELLAIRCRERVEKHMRAKARVTSRHSSFGGTYVVKSMKSISDNDLIYHKPLNRQAGLNFDAEKTRKRTPKNRLPVVSQSLERRSAFSVKLFLKDFCVEFLSGAYNAVMRYVKNALVKETFQAHDESYYLWTLSFFMEFNREVNFELHLVSETMSVKTFHYVQQHGERCFDMIQCDKKKPQLWSRRLHLVVLAYRELFMTLGVMGNSLDPSVKNSSDVIKSNIFYVPEYREFILALLLTYDEMKCSDAFLRDLLETQHIFVKMLKAFCLKRGTLVVQKPTKGKKRANKKATAGVGPVNLNLEGKWDDVASQLSVVLERRTGPQAHAMPFDAASDVPIDDQKALAMRNIQKSLRADDLEGAVALIRAAREVWPENDSFGSPNMAPAEEFIALRDIFFADLGDNNPQPIQPPADNPEEEDEEEEEVYEIQESDLHFEDFAKRLAHPRIVRACTIALNMFDTNPTMTNRAIVKLLHRIAYDCKMYCMLFQLRLFRVFQKIFAFKMEYRYEELVKFATFVMRRFFKIVPKNKVVFMETLFWKSNSEAYDIEYGYGSYNEISRAKVRAWSEQQEDELRRLFMEHQLHHTDEDVLDWIIDNLIDNTRTRRAVLRKLREMCLLVDNHSRKKSGATLKIPQSWDAEEEMQLQELYEQFKDDDDPMARIMFRLDIPRPKNRIIEKMLVLGLIHDKKQVRKKKVKRSVQGQKSGKRKSKVQTGSEDEASNNDSDDNFSHNARPPFSVIEPEGPNKNSRQKEPVYDEKDLPSRSHLVLILLKNIKSGRQAALEWLHLSLAEAMRDLQDGDDEPIPLVPIEDSVQEAMDEPEFKWLLDAFCFCEPCNVQEIYWRIPGNIPVDTLEWYCNLIEEALDGTLKVNDVADESGNEAGGSGCVAGGSGCVAGGSGTVAGGSNTAAGGSGTVAYGNVPSDGHVFRKPRALTKTGDRSSRNDETSDGSSEEDIFDLLRRQARENLKLPQVYPENKRRDSNTTNFAADNEETDDDVHGTTSPIVSTSKMTCRNIIDSDDEDDFGPGSSSTSRGDPKRTRPISDDTWEKPPPKRSRVIDSDDDD